MADLNDIFSEEEGTLSDEELRRYLDANTPPEEKHALEKKMGTSSFESEAVEGLQQFQNKTRLDNYVAQLNKNLQQQLATKKRKKQKRAIKDLPMIVIVVVTILALITLAYMVIHLYQKNKANIEPPAVEKTK